MRRGVFLAGTAAVSAAFAASVAAGSWIEAAVLAGGALAIALVLNAPAAALLLWFAGWPTVFRFADAVLGGGLPALTPDRVLFVLLAGVVAVRWLRRPGSILPIGGVEIAMAAFLAVAALSAIRRGGSRFDLQEGGLRKDFVFLVQGYAVPFGAFFLAKNLLQDDRHLCWLLRTVVAVGVFLGAAGVLQHFTGTTLFFPTRFQHIHEERATGTLSSAVEFGAAVTGALIAAVVRILQARTLPARLALLGAAALIGLSVVLSMTRAVWLGLLVGLAITAFFEPRFRRPLLAAGGTGIFLGALAWPLFAKSDFFRGRVLSLEPIYNRVALGATAINMVAHHPFLGIGFGRYSFLEEKWEYITSVGGVSPQWAVGPGVPHNEFLHVLALVGLAGFVPYAAVFWLGWRSGARFCRTPHPPWGPSRELALVCLGIFGMYAMNGLFSDLMFSPQASHLAYVLLGAVEGRRVREAAARRAGGAA